MDLDVMLEAVEKYMGEEFADMLEDNIHGCIYMAEVASFQSGQVRAARPWSL